jgi:hypothetical protein
MITYDMYRKHLNLTDLDNVYYWQYESLDLRMHDSAVVCCTLPQSFS